jgi:hypothetical protein
VWSCTICRTSSYQRDETYCRHGLHHQAGHVKEELLMKPDHPLVIHIDRQKYEAPKNPMTGAELRHLPHPPIGPDRDLWEVVPGPADDIKIGDQQSVKLHEGQHFYTAPTTINPGADCAPA